MEAEAKEHAVRGLHELFAELLGVTPLQFRLFREGKDLVEVELEVATEMHRRTEVVAQFVGEEPEEGEEKEEGEAAAEDGGGTCARLDNAALAADALEADLEMTAGGLFVPGMTAAGVGEMVPKDPRWIEADEETRREVFEEVAEPVVLARQAADKVLAEKMEGHARAWLEDSCEGAGAEWEQVDAGRSGMVALLPPRIARQAFDKHVEGMRAQQVRVRAYGARWPPRRA